MMIKKWSISLDGKGEHWRIFAMRSGRVIVSSYPRECRAIEPGGEVAWVASGMHADREMPDGMLLVETQDGRERGLLDSDGRVSKRWRLPADAKGEPQWSIDQLLLKTRYCWVEPFGYALRDYRLYRYDATGTLLDVVPVTKEPLKAVLRRWAGSEASMDKFLPLVGRFLLHGRESRRRLIAFDTSIFGLVMSLQLDGTVDWVAMPTPACCNSICFVGDEVTVHASSCGRCLSFLSVDGVVFRRHEFRLYSAVSNENGTVFAWGADAIHAFDARGEPMWTHDLADISSVMVRGTVLYALTGSPKGRALSAFDVSG